MSGNPSIYDLPKDYELADWFEHDDARKAARQIATSRRALEGIIAQHVETLDKAEAAYDKKLAEKFQERINEGAGSGAAEILAKGDASSERGKREGAREALRLLFKRLDGLDGERAVFRQFCDWSARMQDRSAA